MGLPRTNPDGSVTLRSAQSGSIVTVAGPGQLPSGQSPLGLNYYVDFATGNDNNDGLDVARPLKTYRYGLSPKLHQKLLPGGGATGGPTRIWQLSSAPVSDVYWAETWQGGSESGSLSFRGDIGVTTLFTGTITAATLAAVGTLGSFTVPNVDFTPYIGKRARIVAGTNVGAVGWIQAAPALGVANANQPYNYNTDSATGQFRVGDTIVIEELPQAPGMVGVNRQRWENGNPMSFTDLEIGRGPGFNPDVSYLFSGPASFNGCKVNTAWLDLRCLVYFNGCWVSANSGEVTFTGDVEFFNCAINLGEIIAQYVFMTRCVQHGRGLVLQQGALQCSNYLQFWNWASGPAVTLLGGTCGYNNTGRLAGTSAGVGTYGMLLRPGTNWHYAAGTSQRPSLAGAAAYNADIAGTQVLWAAVPTISATRLAGIVEYNT